MGLPFVQSLNCSHEARFLFTNRHHIGTLFFLISCVYIHVYDEFDNARYIALHLTQYLIAN